MNSLALQHQLPKGQTEALSDRKNRCWDTFLKETREGSPITFVPVLLAWGRSAKRFPPRILDRLLGPIERLGFIRTFFLLIGIRTTVLAQVGIALPRGDATASVGKLRYLLRASLEDQKRVIAGPPIRSRKRVVRSLLRRPEVKKAISASAQKAKESPNVTSKRAEKILTAMVSDYHPRYLIFARRVVRWLWNRMFTRLHVDSEGIERVRSILQHHPVILAPCHKSHMDYLLLSWLFYEHDLTPPHIAAGINLSFFPMGTFFRSGGGFFIRRRIAGDALYARLLSSYIRFLIEKGFTQEFFLEGGRSRSGKLLPPKTGLLGIEVDAFLDGDREDLYVVPTAVTYERVPEDEAYVAELSGKAKKKENFWTVFRSGKLLGRSHGAGYVRFAKPISLKEHLSLPSEEVSLQSRKSETAELARNVMAAIASEMTVTTTSLLASVLLEAETDSIAIEDLRQKSVSLREQLRTAGAPLAPEVEEIESTLEKSIAFFLSHGWIRKGDGNQDRVERIEENRSILEFYRNQLLHHLEK